MPRQIAANVGEFLESTASLVGQWHASRFQQKLTAEVIEGPYGSPLEDLLVCAFHALAESQYVMANPGPDSPEELLPGLYVTPQFVIKSYRVDFLVECIKPGGDMATQGVIVELDGHAFHDKDKKQRAYEKARDRDIVRAGFKLLHYTGSEVVKDPFAVAWEAMEFAGVPMYGEYKSSDPLGLFA